MRLFYYMFPGNGMACGPIEATDEQDARRRLREIYDMPRLSRGTQVWETSRREQDALMRNYTEMQRGLPVWASGPL